MSDPLFQTSWDEPGVRLTRHVEAPDASDVEVATAVPVFIGWDSEMSDDVGVLQEVGSWPDYAAGLITQAKETMHDDWILATSIRQYFDNGGRRCFVLKIVPPETQSIDTLHAWIQHYFTWEGVAPVLAELSLTLVAIPQLVGVVTKYLLGQSPAEQAQWLITAWRTLLNACQSRQDLFFVLDAPRDMATAKTCIETLRHNQGFGELGQHAAIYGPHLLTSYTDLNADEAIVPPSGAVLGLMARTDEMQGVWKAPANDALLCVVAPEYRETQASGWFDVSAVTINLIRSFPGRGVRVWGCRTLAQLTGSPFRYVQVRRMVTWVEANLRQICRFAVFEPNQEITWFQLRGLCDAWLRRVWLSGGLAGTEEAKAFSVRVGLNETMTITDIATGRLIIRVGLAVLHAAEFVEINLVLKLNETEGGMTHLQRSAL